MILNRWESLSDQQPLSNTDCTTINCSGAGEQSQTPPPAYLLSIENTVDFRQQVIGEFFRRINDLSNDLSCRTIQQGGGQQLSCLNNAEYYNLSLLDALSPSAIPSSHRDAMLASRLQPLHSIFWYNAELKLADQHFSRVFHDIGVEDVCKRLVMLCVERFQFEPLSDRSSSSVNINGDMRIDCEGVYYKDHSCLGKFVICFNVAKDPTRGNSWCVRLIQWVML